MEQVTGFLNMTSQCPHKPNRNQRVVLLAKRTISRLQMCWNAVIAQKIISSQTLRNLPRSLKVDQLFKVRSSFTLHMDLGVFKLFSVLRKISKQVLLRFRRQSEGETNLQQNNLARFCNRDIWQKVNNQK